MEIYRGQLRDNGSLVKDISDLHLPPGSLVAVEVNLPEYVDITSLLALQRRMIETVRITGMHLRLLASTTNLIVEKYATRMFADRDDIYLTVDWRNKDE